MSAHRRTRDDFRVLTRQRGGYDGMMVDVQLQVATTGALVWVQTFSDPFQAEQFQKQLADDIDTLDDEAFRRKHGVPRSA